MDNGTIHRPQPRRRGHLSIYPGGPWAARTPRIILSSNVPNDRRENSPTACFHRLGEAEIRRWAHRRLWGRRRTQQQQDTIGRWRLASPRRRPSARHLVCPRYRLCGRDETAAADMVSLSAGGVVWPCEPLEHQCFKCLFAAFKSVVPAESGAAGLKTPKCVPRSHPTCPSCHLRTFFQGKRGSNRSILAEKSVKTPVGRQKLSFGDAIF
jgi:hypothetical protein